MTYGSVVSVLEITLQSLHEFLVKARRRKYVTVCAATSVFSMDGGPDLHFHFPFVHSARRGAVRCGAALRCGPACAPNACLGS